MASSLYGRYGKTAKQKLNEALICMTTEQMERFEEQSRKGLQDWEKLHSAEAILGPIDEVVRSRGDGNIQESSRGSKSVLEIEISQRTSGKTAEQRIESYRAPCNRNGQYHRWVSKWLSGEEDRGSRPRSERGS